ncbi:MAG TPA: phosphoribosylformylglycinamidine synthase subunit PurS [Alphaproteobacteria bacterium]|nr:phosphoribosylformylglycinamidine synthase subunit PurS [Alphaproteobacteria bacterium]
MKAIVTVMLRKSVLDPQGKAIGQALHGMGFSEVGDVRQGKRIEIALPDGSDPEAARKRLAEMAEKLLVNPVMEDYTVDIAA